MADFLLALELHPLAKAGEGGALEIRRHAEVGVSGTEFEVDLVIEDLFELAG